MGKTNQAGRAARGGGIGGGYSMIETLESRRMLAAGQLDTTFDGDGRAAMPFGAGQLIGLQPGGKIVLQRTDVGGFRLARVNTNGSVDNTFLGGSTLTSVSGSPTFSVSPVDGRIAYVAATTKSTETQVGVFKADGSPDNSFDTDGKEILTLGYAAQRVAWQGGKLILLGGPSSGDGLKGTLLRLNGDGSQDSAFGTAGKVTLPGTPSQLAGLVVTPDSKINVCADYHQYTSTQFHDLRITRYTKDGGIDTTFGAGAGYIDAASSGDDYNLNTRAFDVEPDGTIYHLSDSNQGMKVRRFNSEGTLTLTSPQIVLPDFAGDGYFPNEPSQIGVQPDGKILLIGEGPYRYSTGNPTGWFVYRLSGIDGTVDTTYGASGASYPKVEHTGNAIVQPDGKVLVSGKRFTADGGDFEVLRLDTGTLGGGTISLNKKGTLIVYGTALGEDMGVRFRAKDGRFVAWVGTNSRAFAPSAVKRIALFGGAGNDTISIGANVRGCYLGGEDGADTLNGGDGADVLVGGLGADLMNGGAGNDSMVGEGGNDSIFGGGGNDILYGNGGNDTLNGGNGNDKMFGGPDDADTVAGGAGTDSAANDTKDTYSGVETLL